jgi:hypothetical protein
MRTHRHATQRSDRGSAMLEFIAVGVGVLVPLAYIVLAAGGVQAAVFASTQAVREAGRAYASAPSAEQAHARAWGAARMAFDDHGLELPAHALTVTCVAGRCLDPGTAVAIDLRWRVPVPWLPETFAGSAPGLVPVHVRHVVPVDDYRGDPA